MAHPAGVGPAWRRAGLARRLYEQFFERARQDGRTVVKAITSAGNDRSIAFHRAMGFTDSEPIKDYDGPSLDRVVFVRGRVGDEQALALRRCARRLDNRIVVGAPDLDDLGPAGGDPPHPRRRNAAVEVDARRGARELRRGGDS